MESRGKISLSYHICIPGKELLRHYGQFLLSSLIKISMDSEIYFLIHPFIYTEITFQAVKRVSSVVLKGFSIYPNLAKYTLLVLPVIINSYKKQGNLLAKICLFYQLIFSSWFITYCHLYDAFSYLLCFSISYLAQLSSV